MFDFWNASAILKNMKKRKTQATKSPALIKILGENTTIVFIAIIVISILISYSNAFNAQLVVDDERVINENSSFSQILNPKALHIGRRIIPSLTFAINARLLPSLASYHAVNIFIHIASSVIVLFILSLILSHIYPNKEDLTNKAKLLGSLIFALHPLQTQATTYISQRYTLIAAFFVLLSVYLFLRVSTNKGPKYIYLLSILCAILAIYSKQNTVVVFLLIALTNAFVFGNKNRKQYIILLGVILAYTVFLVTTLITDTLPRETNLIDRLSYIMSQSRVIVEYIKLSILPYKQNFYHNLPIIKSVNASFVFSSFGLLSLIISAIVFYKKKPLFSFGIFWFFISLAVESSFIPIQDIMFEHRMYLPLFGLICAFIALIIKPLSSTKGIYILLILPIALGLLTHNRNKVWQTEISFWADAYKKSPSKYEAKIGYASSLKNVLRINEAIAIYNSVEGGETNLEVLTSLGLCYEKKHQYEKSRECYEKATTLFPQNALSLKNNIAVSYALEGKREKAIETLNLITDNTKDGQTYYNLAKLHEKTDTEKAILYLEKASKISSNILYQREAGKLLAITGQYEKAEKYFERIISSKDKQAYDYNMLGNINIMLGKTNKAYTNYKEAYRMNKNIAGLKNNIETLKRKGY